MGSLCFSTASILRCESFTALESQLLIIPTAVELLFATSLIYANWGKGRRHLLLTAEGWSYFALALLELLSHNIPAVRDSVSVFSIVDTVLGAASFVPIFFYTLFIYLFTRGELIDTLPKRFQRIASVLLAIFIPAVIALNELSSFIGIHRRTLRNAAGRPVVAIGFASVSDQQLWTFLTSLTLALLTAFQAIAFALTFYRLIRALIDQRRIETTATESSHAVRGTSWLSAGLKLGAIETVVGFAQGGFGGALTRRVVRAVARGCMAVGVAKGVDAVDDFADLAKEMSGGRSTTFRRSRLGMLISNPRASTFRQLSPTAGEFYRANGPTPRGGNADVEKAGGGLAVPQMSEFAQLRLAAGAGARPPASPLYTLAGPQNQLTSPVAAPYPSAFPVPGSSSRVAAFPSALPAGPKPTLQRTLTQGTAYSTFTSTPNLNQQRVTVHFPPPSPSTPSRPWPPPPRSPPPTASRTPSSSTSATPSPSSPPSATRPPRTATPPPATPGARVRPPRTPTRASSARPRASRPCASSRGSSPCPAPRPSPRRRPGASASGTPSAASTRRRCGMGTGAWSTRRRRCTATRTTGPCPRRSTSCRRRRRTSRTRTRTPRRTAPSCTPRRA
ncbi:hypothetical protein DFH08DRAFT_356386 [Mycena albidolilacea]|uniref:Uncharacterized protein n=1 Tax=Mycena albidolilacea TaxID=1033008 RepID=A0AAD7EG75_9AGAR|nr:hypothetical protein DFH08DRAFT_356386 [Mycena albidolilacea]